MTTSEDPPDRRTSVDLPSGGVEAERMRALVEAALFGDPVPAPVRVGKYRIVAPIGAGAMGEVFDAYDDILERRVALKLVRPHRASASATARLLQEAKSLARLDHPNVVRVHDAGFTDDRAWIAMEFVEGGTLRSWLDASDRAEEEILEVLRAAGRGLAAAHAAGLVHRDFKPDNVLVGHDGVARVADFGLVRIFVDPGAGQSGPVDASIPASIPRAARMLLEHTLTHEGTIMGTPAYMPLEQLRGDRVDARSDQFAFCVTAWEALFGSRPFAGSTRYALLEAVARGRVEPPGYPRRSPAVVRALARGLRSRPDERFESMNALLDQLRPRARGRARWRLGGLGAVTAVTVWGTSAPEALVCAQRRRADEIWSVSAAAELRRVYAATNVSFADETAALVSSRLGAYAERWAEAHASICREGELADPERAAVQLACLKDRKLAVQVAVKTLYRSEQGVIEHAVDTVAALPEIAKCLDPKFELFGAETVYSALEPELLEASALIEVGRTDEAERECSSIIEDARLRHDIGARIAGLRARARARFAQGRDDEGIGDLVRAGELANSHQRDVDGIEVWTDLAWHGATSLRDRTRAERWLQRGEELIEQLGADPTKGRMALTRARVLEMSDIDRARRAFDGILALTTDPALARRARDSRADVLMRAGHFEQAAEEYREILEDREREYGPSHPMTADGAYDLGHALDRMGSDEAGDLYRRALELWEAIYPAGNPDVVDSHIGLFNWTLKTGELDEAQRHADAALEIVGRLLAHDATKVGDVWTSVGVVRHARGDYAAAVRAHARASTIYRERLGPQHENTAIAESNRAESLLYLGRVEHAREGFERALEILTAALGAEHPFLAYPTKGLGLVALREGRREQAAERLGDARERVKDIDPTEVLEIDVALLWARPPGDAAERTRRLEQLQARAVALGPPALRRVDAVKRLAIAVEPKPPGRK